MLIARPLVMKSALQSNQFKTRFFNLIWDHLWTHYWNKNFQKVSVYIKTTCILFWSNKDGFYILFVNCRNVKTKLVLFWEIDQTDRLDDVGSLFWRHPSPDFKKIEDNRSGGFFWIDDNNSPTSRDHRDISWDPTDIE